MGERKGGVTTGPTVWKLRRINELVEFAAVRLLFPIQDQRLRSEFQFPSQVLCGPGGIAPTDPGLRLGAAGQAPWGRVWEARPRATWGPLEKGVEEGPGKGSFLVYSLLKWSVTTGKG